MRYFVYSENPTYLGRAWDEKTQETMIYFVDGGRCGGLSFTDLEVQERTSEGYWTEIPVEEAVLKFNL